MSHDQEFRQFEVTELLDENEELRELVLKWRGYANAVSVLFSHYDEKLAKYKKELEAETKKVLEGNE